MLASADSGPCSEATTRASGWCLRNPSSQSVTRPRSAGLPQMRMSPTTCCSGWYGAAVAAVTANASAAAKIGPRPIAATAAAGVTSTFMSVELLQLLADVIRRNRRVGTVLLDDLLAFAREHEAQELAHLRIHRAARRLVDIDIGVARERIAAVGDVVLGHRDRGPAGRGRDREHLHIRIA